MCRRMRPKEHFRGGNHLGMPKQQRRRSIVVFGGWIFVPEGPDIDPRKDIIIIIISIVSFIAVVVVNGFLFGVGKASGSNHRGLLSCWIFRFEFVLDAAAAGFDIDIGVENSRGFFNEPNLGEPDPIELAALESSLHPRIPP